MKLTERLRTRVKELTRVEAAASFGGAGLAIRVREPETLIGDLSEAADTLARYETALRECQQVLARITQPDKQGFGEPIMNAWASCVQAEAKARRALEGSKK